MLCSIDTEQKDLQIIHKAMYLETDSVVFWLINSDLSKQLVMAPNAMNRWTVWIHR